jgi:Cof subfamily protein (haloacid dehalogenase superfamily)
LIDRLPALVASDLDGTLLRDDGTIADRTRAALADVTAAGSSVIAATGRPPRWVEGLHLDLGVDAVCVCMNGAMLLDLGTGEVLAHLPFDAGAAGEIAAAVRAALPGVIFAGQLGARFAREPAWEPMFPHASDLVASLDDLVNETVTKLIVRHPELSLPELAEAVREIAGDRSQVTFSGMSIVELSAPGVHKAAGVASAAKLLGRDPADVLAFGDAPNDIEMLAAAAWGVAMGNAHPDVVAIADEQTVSNEEGGVAVVLERLLRVSSDACT